MGHLLKIAAFSHQLFSQKVSSEMFERVLNMPPKAHNLLLSRTSLGCPRVDQGLQLHRKIERRGCLQLWYYSVGNIVKGGSLC